MNYTKLDDSELMINPWTGEPYGLVAKKYNPNQPRAPKGSKTGGQWTDDDTFDEKPVDFVYGWSESRYHVLSDDQRRALLSYEDGSYKYINRHLRGQEMPSSWENRSAEEKAQIIKDVDIIESAMTPSLDNMTVYRGMLVPYEMAGDLQPGAVFTDPGFLSTTTDVRNAQHFSLGHGGSGVMTLFEIRVPKGTMVTPATEPNEMEILMHRNTSLKIINSGFVTEKLFKVKAEVVK